MVRGLTALSIALAASLAAAIGVSATSAASVMSTATAVIDVQSAASAAAPAVRVAPPQRVVTNGSSSCPGAGRAAIIDRAAQRAWLCTDGAAADKFPITTAISEPSPGIYHVYAKDRLTTSTFGGHFSYLDNFVAFTRGTTGARIAFHAVPRDSAGHPYEPYDALGTLAWYGQSSGCIRVLPAESVVIWDHLVVGDPVIVVS